METAEAWLSHTPAGEPCIAVQVQSARAWETVYMTRENASKFLSELLIVLAQYDQKKGE